MLACRPTLCLAVAVVAGICARVYFPFQGELLGTVVVIFVPFLAWFLLSPHEPGPPLVKVSEAYRPHIVARPGFIARRGLNRFMILLSIVAFLLGFYRQVQWERETDPDRLPSRRWFTATLLTTTPTRIHPGSEGRWRCDALLLDVDGKPIQKPLSLRVYGTDGDPARRGDRLHARVRLSIPEAPDYPGAFDFRFFLNRDGILASAFIVKPRPGRDEPELTVVPVDDPPLHTRTLRILDAIRGAAVAATIRHGGEYGGLLAAMLYGYRDDIGREVRDAFRRVGIGHVLAISGLHVGLIVGLLWWIGGWITWPARWRALVCLILSLFYLGLTGGQVAAVRATTMAAIHLAGIAMGRKSDMLNSLGAAALFLCLANPTAPLDVSFQLSFTAVLFIHVSFPVAFRNSERTGPRRARRKTWWAERRGEMNQLIRLSIATWVGLYPIIAAVFYQVNLAGLPINIVVIPLMSLVLVGGLLVPWLGWIPLIGDILVLPTRILARLAIWTDGFSWSSFPVHPPDWRWTLLFFLATGMYMLRGMFRNPLSRRHWVAACGALVAVCVVGVTATMGSAPPPPDGRASILPGSGGGVIIAEAPGGGIAVLGTVRRGGIHEIGYLHQIRRSGAVGLVATGGDKDGEKADLEYHNGIAATTPLPAAGEPYETSGWQPVPGADGVEYAYGRNKTGKIAWLSARAGEASAGIAPRISIAAYRSVTRRPDPGMDVRLLTLSFSDRNPKPPTAVRGGRVVLVSGRYGRTLPPGWYERNSYGVVVADGARLSGWDGDIGAWREISGDGF
ncbi:MAG: ComEC family competence protein [Planctomycetaceae bacterium]|nr:ComEC family competence protein [Planctomycetaceae bacterium]